MRRRDFITLLGGVAAAWPLAARAQQPATAVIGFLGIAPPDTIADRLRAFRNGLKGIGYIEGENAARRLPWALSRWQARGARPGRAMHRGRAASRRSRCAVAASRWAGCGGALVSALGSNTRNSSEASTDQEPSSLRVPETFPDLTARRMVDRFTPQCLAASARLSMGIDDLLRCAASAAWLRRGRWRRARSSQPRP
jgi:hypothetical protein